MKALPLPCCVLCPLYTAYYRIFLLNITTLSVNGFKLDTISLCNNCATSASGVMCFYQFTLYQITLYLYLFYLFFNIQILYMRKIFLLLTFQCQSLTRDTHKEHPQSALWTRPKAQPLGTFEPWALPKKQPGL